jgi:hypothetical protein
MTRVDEQVSGLMNAGGIDAASVVGARCACPACLAKWPSRHGPDPSADPRTCLPPGGEVLDRLNRGREPDGVVGPGGSPITE